MACALLLAGTQASAADALPDFLFPFPPATNAAEATPIPLRPPDIASVSSPARSRRLLRSRTPPFAFPDGDRVLFLGDQLLRGELDYGHFETRLTSQYPNSNVTFRNLSWLANHPLATPVSADEPEPLESWLDPLLNRADRIRPTIVFLGFGTGAAPAGEPGLTSFRANLDRLIDGLLTSPAYPPPRLVILSPLSRELASPSTADTDEQEAKLSLYADHLWEVASSRQCEFVDLYGWSEAVGRASRTLPEPDQSAARAITKDGLRLTQYGYWRMTPVLEWALHWSPNSWRFGYMADNTLRGGQFGIELTQRNRSGRQVTARTIEDRLPTPIPPGILDTDPTPRPRCYIQITGLEPGVYALHVDGERIVEGTEAEWDRYQTVSQGPSWDQAERLRQTIVRKNNLLLSARLSEDPPQPHGDLADPRVEELETQIATLRKPVPHSYQLHRVGTDEEPPTSTRGGPRIRHPSDGR